MIQIHFRIGENQSRWAWTAGLNTLGQQEIAVLVSWPEHDPRDTLLINLLRFLENYLNTNTTRILPAQTLRYGWTLLRFVPDEHQISGVGADVLLAEEKQQPFSQDDVSFVPGVARTMALMQLQNDAMRRNKITGDAHFPTPFHRAIVCSRVTPDTIQHVRPLMAHRVEKPTSDDSGWFFGCCEQAHDHDNPDELAIVHLHHLVERFPGLFPYIAMPVGYQLLFEEHRAIIWHPGEESGKIDPVNLLIALPV